MRFVQLQLGNFRGFERLSLDFHERLTVLVGVNGSGKTTILDALALCLCGAIRPFDLRRGSESTWVRVEWQSRGRRRHLRFEPGETVPDDAALPWRDLQRGHAAAILLQYRVGRTARDRTPGSLDARVWSPALAMEGAHDAGANFSDLFAWFREREDLENQERARGTSDYRDPQLDQVRRALTGMLPEWADPRVLRPGSPGNDFGRPVLAMRKQDTELAFDQLSEGERALIAMVSDIARRLAIANPGSSALDGAGVVLIDEIELHLHPRWQAEVIGRLLDTFPNVQFIVTTHAPIVLSRVQPECVRLLRDFDILQPDATYGHDANALLEDVFGVRLRPAEVQALIDQVAAAIDDNRLEDARAKLAELSQRVGAGEHEVTRLRSMIDLLSA